MPAESSALSTVYFDADPEHRGRRALYALTTAALTVIMLLAVLDGVSDVNAFGVGSTWSSDSGGGSELRVHHTLVTRPALASPFDIEVHRPGGFEGPIEIAVDRRYLQLWDLNGIYPDPAAQRSEGDDIVWEFDPPSTAEVLYVVFDARIEPAAQSGRDGSVALLDGDAVVAQVDFHTAVRP